MDDNKIVSFSCWESAFLYNNQFSASSFNYLALITACEEIVFKKTVEITVIEIFLSFKHFKW